MRKVAVIGLHSIKNAGDVVLCDVTGHLIRTLCPEAEIVRVDVNKVSQTFTGRWSALQKAWSFLFRALQRVDRDLFSYRNKSRFRYRFEYTMWYLQNHRQYTKLLSGADAIVFAGGGFLKFRTQGLNYHVEQIIRIAAKNKIPVMMNGVGIEGYDEDDIRCQRLKAMLNNDCVKVITTRDNIEILQENYITNKNTVTARVGDPALWVRECYSQFLLPIRYGDAPEEKDGSSGDGVPEATKSAPLVGINVIRGNVYKDYGNSLSEFELLNFYKQLIRELDARGIRWQLFSNGMKADNSFGKKLLQALKSPDEKVLSPSDPVRFCQLLQTYDCVIGARLHACIIAYALNIPVVGLIWNDKTLFFSEVTDRREFYFDEKQLSAEGIADGVLASMETPYDPAIREELRQLTLKYLTFFVENHLSAGAASDGRHSGKSGGADRSME